MGIKSIRLRNYKRFTDISIVDVPKTAKLVVLIGPNGSGKSSIFDSFLLKKGLEHDNFALRGKLEQYYEKILQAQTTHEIGENVNIDFHESRDNSNLKPTFYVRSAYRNEADFHLENLSINSAQIEKNPLTRIIDDDQSVSANYGRLMLKGHDDLYFKENEETNFGAYRKKHLGKLKDAVKNLFTDLDLQDFGSLTASTFRFSKGGSNDFQYKNLSGGEKAAFDVILDVFLKCSNGDNIVYCIDEPELHIATNLQGPLIFEVIKLLPDSAQLWVATHSIGIVKEASRIMKDRPGEVVFLDLFEKNFDDTVCIKPSAPDRTFWQQIYKETVDDLAGLIAPKRIVICEGKKDDPFRAFDPKCYNELFKDENPPTLFISRGGCKDVIKSVELIKILQGIVNDIQVFRLIDRDEMTDNRRESLIMNESNMRVLHRREIEEYLWDPEVLSTFLRSHDCDEPTVSNILAEQEKVTKQRTGSQTAKKASKKMFEIIRKNIPELDIGNSKNNFALQHLVPALKETPKVFNELRMDIFEPQSRSCM